MFTDHKKNCPKCGKIQYYSRVDVFNLAVKNNWPCLSCSQKGRNVSDETKEKLRMASSGFKRPQQVKDKISSTMKGRKGNPHSEETKHKLRLATINSLKKRGCIPSARNYNPIACQFIDRLNQSNGWSLRHALNGGEEELYGYFIDGYDKERNIIFEYDEIHHERRDRKEKDRIKQERLIREIHPTDFIRYNEKENKLYSVYENI